MKFYPFVELPVVDLNNPRWRLFLMFGEIVKDLGRVEWHVRHWYEGFEVLTYSNSPAHNEPAIHSWTAMQALWFERSIERKNSRAWESVDSLSANWPIDLRSVRVFSHVSHSFSGSLESAISFVDVPQFHFIAHSQHEGAFVYRKVCLLSYHASKVHQLIWPRQC